MTLTPGMQQYYEIKKENPDSILFFRMGDFYEMFDEDAILAHKILGINVTSRNKNSKNPIPLAGIPYHAKDKYLPILVNAGYKVSIAEQVSNPKLKGIVKREVVRTVTPSTLNLEGETYSNQDANINNYIISIVEKDKKYGLSFIESSNLVWKSSEFENFDKLSTQIYKISPKEIILEKKLFGNEEIKNILEKKYNLNIYYYDNDDKQNNIYKHFGVKDLSGFGLENKFLAIKASNLLLAYLKENQKSELTHLKNIGIENYSDFLELDESTINNLDLIYNYQTKSNTIGTLFGILNKTNTQMGKRFLRDSIIKPLKDINEIEIRQNIINELLKDKILLEKIISKLKQISDLENILSRLALNRVVPRDLLNLQNSLQNILDILEIIKNQGSNKLKKLFNLI